MANLVTRADLLGSSDQNWSSHKILFNLIIFFELYLDVRVVKVCEGADEMIYNRWHDLEAIRELTVDISRLLHGIISLLLNDYKLRRVSQCWGLRAAILVVGAYVLQGAQNVAGRGRRPGQVLAHHMEAELIGYVARLDGHALRRGVAKDANGLQGTARCLHIDAVAGLEGELEDARLVQGRDPIVRNLGIAFALAHQTANATHPHQSGVQLTPEQRQAQPSDQQLRGAQRRERDGSAKWIELDRVASTRSCWRLQNFAYLPSVAHSGQTLVNLINYNI